MNLRRCLPAVLYLLAAAATLPGCGSSSSSIGEGVRVCQAGTFEPSYAELTELHRFKELPIRVYFENRVTYGDGETDLNEVARQALAEWTTATGGVIQFAETTNRNAADIRVQTRVLSGPPLNGEELGETTFSFSGARQLDAEVTMFAWNGMTRAEATQGFRSTAAHEFGHALGIVSHSDRRGDLMFPSKNTTADIRPSTRDVNTIRTAYCTEFGRSRAQCVPASEPGVRRTGRVSCRSSRVVGGASPSVNAWRSARGERP